MINILDIDAAFPKASYREGQRQAIEFIAKSFASDKQVVILEAPTGSGKSAIGYTIMEMFNMTGSNGYYVTSSKQLQDQLRDEFLNEMVELKGRSSYKCDFWSREREFLLDTKQASAKKIQDRIDQFVPCSEGFCKEVLDKSMCNKCFLTGRFGGTLNSLPAGMRHSACSYYEQVYSAVAANKIIMNFSSFLYQMSVQNRFDKRGVLVIDEAHNSESQIMDYVSFTISDRYIRSQGLKLPCLHSAYDYIQWFQSVDAVSAMARSVRDAINNGQLKLAADITRAISTYNETVSSIVAHPDMWVSDFSEHNKYASVSLKPVVVDGFANDLLFSRARHVLMMSATILDVNVLCKSLGLNKSNVAAYRMKNRFPVENRKIYIDPAARIAGGAKKMHEWSDKLVNKVTNIVRKYSGKRGIIHTANFAIMDLLISKCPPDVCSRFLNQRDFVDKTAMLDHHSDSEDSVIVAPAMHEGVDLKDDLSRFQIICKVPYPNFFDDKQLKQRNEIDSEYIPWLTALRLVQSTGRSIRSENDWADTYIIDACINDFMRMSSKYIPSWFNEAVIRL